MKDYQSPGGAFAGCGVVLLVVLFVCSAIDGCQRTHEVRAIRRALERIEASK